MTALTLLLAVSAFAADVAVAAPAPTPFWMKALGWLGAATFIWKLLQGKVPVLLAFLEPLAMRGVDLFVLAVMSQPVLRWLVIGNKENFLATADALLNGLEHISDKIQERLKADLDAASAGQQLPPADPPPPAAPPA
jgi:hypothetical protein